jgi:surface protein
MHWFKTDSLLSVSDRLFMILICSVLLFHPAFSRQFKIEWFVQAQIAAYLITSVVAFIVCTKLTKLDWSHFDLKKVWAICLQRAPYALLIFLMAIYIRSDVFLMERILPHGKEEAGVYAASYRFLDVSNNVTGVLFAGILLPLFGRMLAKKEDVRPLVKLSLNLLLPVALTAMFIAIFFGQEIMHLQLKKLATDYDGKVFALLMMAFPGYCIGYVYATLLTANGNIRPLVIVSLIAVLLNITLNLILLPIYGAIGAAFVCVLTQAFLSVVNILLAKKIIGMDTDFLWILKYVLFAIIICALCYCILKLEITLWQQILAVGFGAAITMFICGFLPFRRLKELLQNR